MRNEIQKLYIAYSSESGNTEVLAKQLANEDWLAAYSPTLATLNEFNLNQPKENDLLLVLTSSFGDGEPPANGDEFVNNLEN